MSNSDIKESSSGLEYKQIALITFYCDSIDGACFWYRLMKSENEAEYYFSNYKGSDAFISTDLGQRIESMLNHYGVD